MPSHFELDFTGRVAPLPSLRELVQPLVDAFPKPMTLADLERESDKTFALASLPPTFTVANLHAIADAARRADRLCVTEPVRAAGAPPAELMHIPTQEPAAATAMSRVLAQLASDRKFVEAAMADVTDALAMMGASKAAREVLAERQRQVSVEGFDQAHDAGHKPRELSDAAGCYAISAGDEAVDLLEAVRAVWPWSLSEFKPKGWRRDCVRAAALLLAALELDDTLQAGASGAGSPA